MSYIKLFGEYNGKNITETTMRYNGMAELKRKLMHFFVELDVALFEGGKHKLSMEVIDSICAGYLDEGAVSVSDDFSLVYKNQIKEFTHFKANIFVNGILLSISDLKPLDHQGRVYDAMSFVVGAVGNDVSYGICKLMSDVFESVRDNADPFSALQVCRFIYDEKEYIINFEKEIL